MSRVLAPAAARALRAAHTMALAFSKGMRSSRLASWIGVGAVTTHIGSRQERRVAAELKERGGLQLLGTGLVGAVDALAQLGETLRVDVKADHPPAQRRPCANACLGPAKRHRHRQAHIPQADHRGHSH